MSRLSVGRKILPALASVKNIPTSPEGEIKGMEQVTKMALYNLIRCAQKCGTGLPHARWEGQAIVREIRVDHVISLRRLIIDMLIGFS